MLYMLFIQSFVFKGLPSKSDNDVLDLDPTCQITRDLNDSEQFLKNACRALQHSRTATVDSSTKNATSLKKVCRKILSHLNKGISMTRILEQTLIIRKIKLFGPKQ